MEDAVSEVDGWTDVEDAVSEVDGWTDVEDTDGWTDVEDTVSERDKADVEPMNVTQNNNVNILHMHIKSWHSKIHMNFAALDPWKNGTALLSASCQILTDFHNIFTTGKHMKFPKNCR